MIGGEGDRQGNQQHIASLNFIIQNEKEIIRKLYNISNSCSLEEVNSNEPWGAKRIREHSFRFSHYISHLARSGCSKPAQSHQADPRASWSPDLHSGVGFNRDLAWEDQEHH